MQPQKEELWPSIVSVVIPLIQLLLVFSVNLSEALSFRKLFLFSEILMLVNVLTVFLTLSFIAWFWYWRNNVWLLFQPTQKNFKTQFEEGTEKKFIPAEQKIFSLIKKMSIISSISFLIFIITVVVSISGIFFISKFWLGTIQYFTYCIFLSLTGLVIYIWISEFVRKKQTFQREDFIRNLLNTLRAHGIIPSPNVKIFKNQTSQGWTAKIVELEIDKKRYIVVSSFDGLEIFEIYSKKEYEELIKKSSQT